MTVRRRVERSPTSSTMPSSAHGSMVMLSPTANQPSKNMNAPARMSVRKRWPEKAISSTISEAPATVVTLPAPGIWASA